MGAVLADTPVDVADATMGQLCDRVRLIRGYGAI